MNRILSIPAEQLHPGDTIVAPHALHGSASTAAYEVREPGVFTRGGIDATPNGCVEIAVFGADPAYPWTAKRLHTVTLPANLPLDIDRPNLIIPGLEA